MNDVILDSVSDGTSQIPPLKRSRDGFNRSDVIKAFSNAFDMIGGTTRLALWANANPDKFYPLYAKLLPATTINLGDSGRLEIVHRIAPTALDQHDQVNVPQQPMEHELEPEHVQDVTYRDKEDNAHD